jgi:zinc transport system substrate-binding protein
VRRALSTVGVILLVAVTGCGGGDDADGGRTTVAASFAPLAEVAERLGGDAVEVTDLTPAGTEPHDVELAPDQVDDLLDADLAVVLGGGFQPAVEDLVDQRDGPTVVVLDALEVDADEGEEGDLHVWLDPTQQARIVGALAEALADVAPDAAGDVEVAAGRYRSELEELDSGLAARLSGCERDLVVTAHDAFGPLTSRYGLRTESVTGPSPGAEPDPATLAELADLVAEEGVTTVFTEPLVDPGGAEALAREAGVTTAVLDPIESRTEGGYLGAMARNSDALAQALGCP